MKREVTVMPCRRGKKRVSGLGEMVAKKISMKEKELQIREKELEAKKEDQKIARERMKYEREDKERDQERMFELMRMLIDRK